MPQVKKKSFIQKNGLIAVWTMAGFMAMGYIGFLATGNGSLDTRQPLVVQNEIPFSAAQVSPVLKEVAALTAKVEDLTSREQKLSKQVTYLKDAFGVETSSLPDEKEKPVEKTTQKIEKTIEKTPKKTPKLVVAAAPKIVITPKPYEKVTIKLVPLTQEDKLSGFSSDSSTLEQLWHLSGVSPFGRFTHRALEFVETNKWSPD